MAALASQFRDAARRLGHPVVIEQSICGDTDFSQQLR